MCHGVLDDVLVGLGAGFLVQLGTWRETNTDGEMERKEEKSSPDSCHSNHSIFCQRRDRSSPFLTVCINDSWWCFLWSITPHGSVYGLNRHMHI